MMHDSGRVHDNRKLCGLELMRDAVVANEEDVMNNEASADDELVTEVVSRPGSKCELSFIVIVRPFCWDSFSDVADCLAASMVSEKLELSRDERQSGKEQTADPGTGRPVTIRYLPR